MALLIRGKEFNPDTVRSIFQCPTANCKRTIISYSDGTSESRHSNGIPENEFSLVAAGRVVRTLCDKHGGREFPGVMELAEHTARTAANIALRSAENARDCGIDLRTALLVRGGF